MRVIKKRRPDLRKIRPTKSYTVAELAEETSRTEATIREWLAAGMPAMDDQQPAMVLGWAARSWIKAKWEKRRHESGPLRIYCFGCKEPQFLEPHSISVHPCKGGATKIKARCAVCGSAIYRAMTGDKAVAFQADAARLWNEEKRLVVHGSLSVRPTYEAGPEAGASSDVEPAFLEAVSSALPEASSGANEDAASPAWHPALLPRNPHDERLKHSFFEYCEHAAGRAPKSIRKDEIAILHYEDFSGFADFGSFTKENAIAFKTHLKAGALRAPTILFILKSLKRFFSWLGSRPGYGRRIRVAEVQYLNLTAKERRASQIVVSPPFPTLAEIDLVLRGMPSETPEQKRDRALIALLAISGIRIGAAVTLRLKHVDVKRCLVRQVSHEVATKFSKDISTFLLPLNPLWEEFFLDWVGYLRTGMSLGDDDPLFPATRFERGRGASFRTRKLSKEFWADAQMATRIVKRAFKFRGYSAYGPHSFRHMIGHEMDRRELSIPQYKAWSQNLGHSSARTTLTSYGKLSLHDQEKLVRNASSPKEFDAALERMAKDFEILKSHKEN
jgi:integrase